MLVVGLSGGLNWAASERFQETSNFLHDAAAAIVRDGRIVAALEEERDNRLKHTNKFPIGAIRHCLHEAGVGAEDVDCWAYCFGNVLEVLATNASWPTWRHRQATSARGRWRPCRRWHREKC